MSRSNNRRSQPGQFSTEVILLWTALGIIAVVVGVTAAAVHITHALAGGAAPKGNPVDIFFAVASGKTRWTTTTSVSAAGFVLAILLLVWLGKALWSRKRGRRSRVDSTARFLGRGDDIVGLSEPAVRQTANRLGVSGSVGVPIGITVSSQTAIFGSWEDMHIDIWGPRTGKTTSRAIPAILAAPGATLVTSNKRDVVDATRGLRASAGPVWIFDPQGIAQEEPQQWWWNPLSYCVDEVKAAKMAEHFAAGSRDAGARTDAFFDSAGQDLLAGLLLAAALAQRPITDVYHWLTRPSDDEPVQILKDHNFDLTSDLVAGVVFAPDKQRGGVFGTAQQMASCLTNRKTAAWVTPTGPGDSRTQFNPTEFVRSGGTLYSLSKEGRGTAGPLVTALTVAVVEAAEELAVESPGGRLAVPLLGVLDEAANVCKWSELPNLYSHYGSRGIVLMTILQSWSQGVDVWGEAGMKKLWSAANIKCYGGGVDESDFLEHLSKVIGDFDKTSRSVSTGKGQRNVSEQLQRERILDVSDLASLPRGRAVVLASGSRPTLIRTQPWMDGGQADKVRASIARYSPQVPVIAPRGATQARVAEAPAAGNSAPPL